MIKKEGMVKILGTVVTIAGAVGTLLTSWLDEQKLDKKIEEKVNEALAEQNQENEGS